MCFQLIQENISVKSVTGLFKRCLDSRGC